MYVDLVFQLFSPVLLFMLAFLRWSWDLKVPFLLIHWSMGYNQVSDYYMVLVNFTVLCQLIPISRLLTITSYNRDGFTMQDFGFIKIYCATFWRSNCAVWCWHLLFLSWVKECLVWRRFEYFLKCSILKLAIHLGY